MGSVCGLRVITGGLWFLVEGLDQCWSSAAVAVHKTRHPGLLRKKVG